MQARRRSPFAVAGAILAAGLVLAAPASAAVKYDPGTMTGFVGGTDVQKAFGWTAPALASKAAGVVFDHEFWTDDTYSVACGTFVFPVVHHRDYGRFELTDAVVRPGSRQAAAGYAGRPLGFRISGAHSGISGTSVPPMAGQPCPEHPGLVIDRAALVSTTTGWALTAASGSVSHRLLVH
jgi:hypothetical protein